PCRCTLSGTKRVDQSAKPARTREEIMITRRGLLEMSAAGAAFSAAGLVSQGVAQSIAKTVHMLSGFTPGTQDAMARLIGGQMKDYAVSIVVETRPGARGRIAVEAVKA